MKKLIVALLGVALICGMMDVAIADAAWVKVWRADWVWVQDVFTGEWSWQWIYQWRWVWLP